MNQKRATDHGGTLHGGDASSIQSDPIRWPDAACRRDAVDAALDAGMQAPLSLSAQFLDLPISYRVSLPNPFQWRLPENKHPYSEPLSGLLAMPKGERLPLSPNLATASSATATAGCALRHDNREYKGRGDADKGLLFCKSLIKFGVSTQGAEGLTR
jgi:hypothetical protein